MNDLGENDASSSFAFVAQNRLYHYDVPKDFGDDLMLSDASYELFWIDQEGYRERTSNNNGEWIKQGNVDGRDQALFNHEGKARMPSHSP
jgi:hypothetical protein